MSIAIAVGVLTAAAVYLFMQRGMIRIVLGFVLISHAANLVLFAAGNTAFRGIPYVGSADTSEQADPLPQAFVLTAIVIAFSITMFMITLAITTTVDDDTEDADHSPLSVFASAETGDPASPHTVELDIHTSLIAGQSERGEPPAPSQPPRTTDPQEGSS